MLKIYIALKAPISTNDTGQKESIYTQSVQKKKKTGPNKCRGLNAPDIDQKCYVPTKQFTLNEPSNIQRDRLIKIYITLNAPILTNETGQKE